eukprot:153018-Pleurochrysis_carterae.AAC.1
MESDATPVDVSRVGVASSLAGVIRPTYIVTAVRGYPPPRGIESRSTDGQPTPPIGLINFSGQMK